MNLNNDVKNNTVNNVDRDKTVINVDEDKTVNNVDEDKTVNNVDEDLHMFSGDTFSVHLLYCIIGGSFNSSRIQR